MIVSFSNISLNNYSKKRFKNKCLNNLSFGLNANNRQAIKRLHQNSDDKISVIKSFDMQDPDIQPCIDEFSHIVSESPTNSEEMNVILDQLNSASNKKGIRDCLSYFAKYWTKLFLSTRIKASEVMDSLRMEHPPVGYLSRTATNPLYKDIAIRNIENANNYITENVEKDVCPDKNLLINLHKIITSDLPFVTQNGEEYASCYYSGVIKNSLDDEMMICPNDIDYSERTDEFMTWLERNYQKEDSFHLIAQSYKKLLGICPFYDANGRTIRAFIDALLYSKGYRLKDYPVNYAEARNMKTQDLRKLFELNCEECV